MSKQKHNTEENVNKMNSISSQPKFQFTEANPAGQIQEEQKQGSKPLSRSQSFREKRRSSYIEAEQSWAELLPSIIFMVLIVAIVLYAMYDYKQILELFDRFITWVRERPYVSSVAIIAIYIGLVVLTMPIMYLSIALGYAYTKAFNRDFGGYCWGFAVITFGLLSGGIIAFTLSRHFFYDIIKRRLLRRNRGFFMVDKVIISEGWKIIFLIRVTPLPFAFLSYLLGVTKAKLQDFIIGTCSVAFHVVVWLYVGQSIQNFEELQAQGEKKKDVDNEYVFLTLEILVVFLVAFMISFKAKMVLDREMANYQSEDEESFEMAARS